jgi:hypothetical protein
MHNYKNIKFIVSSFSCAVSMAHGKENLCRAPNPEVHGKGCGAPMPASHCAHRPRAGGWQVGPVFAVRQTPRRTAKTETGRWGGFFAVRQTLRHTEKTKTGVNLTPARLMQRREGRSMG